ncbi:type IV secretory system conjugative DNA transfer family protein [Oricola indica]|uniref:type IV secretory system conjugative DNA transfer family protein n=1 Tax=Oricola indica TaxID=2872591 RepID=UPI001CBC5D6E|nr:type IV secretory system conjugative DNA transfer family protein [Oricola indica]
MSKNPFDLTGGFGSSVSDFRRYFDTGMKVSRHLTGLSLKKQLEQQGFDPITIDAAVEAVKAGRDPAPVLDQARRAYALREKQAAMRTNPPPVHGSARWARPDELQDAGLIRPLDGRSLSLGKVAGQPLTWDGESHLLTIAPTRSGKSTMQIVPNLLNYRGAAVVLDPKGELYQATAKWREENVGPVYVLNPFEVEGVPTTHAFNPLDGVKDSQTALELSEILYPRTQDDKQQFFENEAIGLLAAVVEFTARFAEGDDRSLATIRNTLSTLDRDLFGLMKVMADDIFPPSIRNAARNFMTKSRDTGQPRVLDSLNTHLRLWDNAGLQRCTARSDFSFGDLKDNPATVYLVLPFSRIGPFSTFVRMIFATALDAMLLNQRKPDIPVLFVMDEFLALDRDDRFVSALRTHASAGVRLWFFLQDLPTLEQKYPTTWQSFLQAEAKSFFGTGDMRTAKLVSEYLGDTTVSYEVPNMSASTTGGASGSASYSISENLHLAGRNLMTPDEVIDFMSGNASARSAIHFLRDVRPVQAQLTPWFNDEELRSRV